MIYYITKYSLSNGGKIGVRNECEISTTYDRAIWFKNARIPLILGKDVFTDENEAKKAVLAARNKEIASLEERIEKLRKIKVSK